MTSPYHICSSSISDREAMRFLARLVQRFQQTIREFGRYAPELGRGSRNRRRYRVAGWGGNKGKTTLLKLAAGFDDPEDRQKVMSIVYDEFRREYSSTIK